MHSGPLHVSHACTTVESLRLEDRVRVFYVLQTVN